jgi:hypothetical protein
MNRFVGGGITDFAGPDWGRLRESLARNENYFGLCQRGLNTNT